MIPDFPQGGSIALMRRQIADLTRAVNAMAGGGIAEAGSDGADSISLGSGTIRVPRRQLAWVLRVRMTSRQIEGGGTITTTVAPGTNMQYKVTPVGSDLESGWITPWRQFDIASKGYMPAAIDDPDGDRSLGLLVLFPNGTSGAEPMLFVQEMQAGVTCS